MLGLLGYIVVVEPNLTLNPDEWLSQSWLWTIGYGFYVLLMEACARAAWRSPQVAREWKTERVVGPSSELVADSSILHAPSFLTRLRRVALAFVPSSMTLEPTTLITLANSAIL